MNSGGYYGRPPKERSLMTDKLVQLLRSRGLTTERINEVIRIEQANSGRHNIRQICNAYGVPLKPVVKKITKETITHKKQPTLYTHNIKKPEVARLLMNQSLQNQIIESVIDRNLSRASHLLKEPPKAQSQQFSFPQRRVTLPTLPTFPNISVAPLSLEERFPLPPTVGRSKDRQNCPYCVPNRSFANTSSRNKHIREVHWGQAKSHH